MCLDVALLGRTSIDHGIAAVASHGKDVIFYKAEVLRRSSKQALQLVADAVLRPVLTPEEMEEGRVCRLVAFCC